MALVRFGGGIAEIRGSIGGTVFSRNASGAIARNRVTPVNPNTTFQDDQRSYLATAVDGFRNLTAAKVDEWNTFAQTLTFYNALGDPFTPSAEQVYIKSTMNLLRAGAAALSAAPIGNPDPPSVNMNTAALTGTVAAGVLTTFEITGVAANGAARWTIWATPPLSPSVNNPARYLKAIANYSGSDPNADHITEYLARFGVGSMPAVAGQKIFARVRAISSVNGFSSALYDIEALVTV